MKVKKSDFGKALRFCGVVSDFAYLDLGDGLNLGASFYLPVVHHYAHIETEESEEGSGTIDVRKVLKALNGFGKELNLEVQGNALVLYDDTLTVETALKAGEEKELRKDKEKATVMFYPANIPDLKLFLRMAEKVADVVKIEIGGIARLVATNPFGDEVKYEIPSTHKGAGKGAFHAKHLANASKFLKDDYSELSITELGTLSFMINYNDSLRLNALVAPVEGYA